MFLSNNTYLIIVAVVIACLAVLALLIGFIIKKNKNKKPKIKVNDEFADKLLQILGGSKNVKAVRTDNGGRVAIDVEDVDKLDLEAIKEIASGVFITGSTIKALYREDSQAVKNAIEKRI